MDKINYDASVIAYYLSEYDKQAIKELGYTTITGAFEKLSEILGKNNSYIKMRRDEFDALPTSSSSRKGWRNRPPAQEVLDVADELRNYDFEQLTVIVKDIIKSYR